MLLFIVFSLECFLHTRLATRVTSLGGFDFRKSDQILTPTLKKRHDVGVLLAIGGEQVRKCVRIGPKGF